MDIAARKGQLIAKERELTAEVAGLRADGSAQADGDVGDSADAAVSEEAASQSLDQAAMTGTTLRLVREALERIDEGGYGMCAVCGRPIEEARLKAVPWTPYCLNDQELVEAETNAPQGGVTL